MTTRNNRPSLAARVDCYVLAALPADHIVAHGLCADELCGYAMDRLDTRHVGEGRRVEDVLRFSEMPVAPTTVREWAVSL